MLYITYQIASSNLFFDGFYDDLFHMFGTMFGEMFAGFVSLIFACIDVFMKLVTFSWYCCFPMILLQGAPRTPNAAPEGAPGGVWPQIPLKQKPFCAFYLCK